MSTITHKAVRVNPRPLQGSERTREILMMKQLLSGGWPQWPFLPVKHSMSFGMPECGVLFDSGPLGKGIKVEPIVYDHNLFSPAAFDSSKVLAQYDSIEAMVDDGWVVD